MGLEFIMMLTSIEVLRLSARNTALPMQVIPVRARKLMVKGFFIRSDRLLASPLQIIYIIEITPAKKNRRNAIRMGYISNTSHRYRPKAKTVLQRREAIAPNNIAFFM